MKEKRLYIHEVDGKTLTTTLTTTIRNRHSVDALTLGRHWSKNLGGEWASTVGVSTFYQAF
jgi:hypothetical protein